MKSLVVFYGCILQDAGASFGISTIRDYKTITERVEKEGLSFLTITLPMFAAGLERALDDGRIQPDLFPGFRRGKGCFPAFLQGFTARIFDSSSGLLLSTPCVGSIFAIRQICLLAKKVELDCSPERVSAAYARYVECDKEVLTSESSHPESFWVRFRKDCQVIWGDMLASLEATIYNGDVIPNHGPGATSDRLSSNGRWVPTTWTHRLEAVFPALEYAFPNFGWYSSTEYQSMELLLPDTEVPVRVISVPKTLKTPRIIAIEPAHMMFVQQGILDAFRSAMRSFTPAKDLVCFDSQEPNRQMALIGSKDGSLATLDLKEASDRVSSRHVKELLYNTPWLYQAVFACRSSKADVPGHGLIDLAKFASMGSALCFPLESIVFATVVLQGIADWHNTPLTPKNVNRFRRNVRVYGDDIVVPTQYATAVVQSLESHGFVVNTKKSFLRGNFRESCGMDAFLGYSITPVKMKHPLPDDRGDVEGIVSTVSLRNALFKSNYVYFRSAVEYLDGLLDRLVTLPVVEEGSPILGRVSYDPPRVERMNPFTQVPEVKGVYVDHSIPADRLDGVGALMKCFTMGRNSPIMDPLHLQRSGRPRSSKLKTGWGSPFGRAEA